MDGSNWKELTSCNARLSISEQPKTFGRDAGIKLFRINARRGGSILYISYIITHTLRSLAYVSISRRESTSIEKEFTQRVGGCSACLSLAQSL